MFIFSQILPQVPLTNQFSSSQTCHDTCPLVEDILLSPLVEDILLSPLAEDTEGMVSR